MDGKHTDFSFLKQNIKGGFFQEKGFLISQSSLGFELIIVCKRSLYEMLQNGTAHKLWFLN